MLNFNGWLLKIVQTVNSGDWDKFSTVMVKLSRFPVVVSTYNQKNHRILVTKLVGKGNETFPTHIQHIVHVYGKYSIQFQIRKHQNTKIYFHFFDVMALYATQTTEEKNFRVYLIWINFYRRKANIYHCLTKLFVNNFYPFVQFGVAVFHPDDPKCLFPFFSIFPFFCVILFFSIILSNRPYPYATQEMKLLPLWQFFISSFLWKVSMVCQWISFINTFCTEFPYLYFPDRLGDK